MPDIATEVILWKFVKLTDVIKKRRTKGDCQEHYDAFRRNGLDKNGVPIKNRTRIPSRKCSVEGYNNKVKHVGYFINKHVAAYNYNLWAKKLHGAFVKLNVIPEGALQ